MICALNPHTGRWLSRDPLKEWGGKNLYVIVRNDPANYIDVLGAIGWGPGGSAGQVDITIPGPSRRVHYNRNDAQSGQLPNSPAAADQAGWNGDVPAIYHQQGNYTDGRDSSQNQKFVSPNGFFEVVFDQNGAIVNDSVNRGTYNFGDPVSDPIGHMFNDVIPYYIYGNDSDDPTAWYDRLLGPFIGFYDGDIDSEKTTDPDCD
jgi:hypothetical protein